MKTKPAPHVLIGDRLLPREEACVSVEDRGFLYGDGIYETLRIYGGCPYLLGEHLRRLRKSAHLLYMELPWSDRELAGRIARLLEANRIPESRLRVTVTRGLGDVRARPDQMRDPLLVARQEGLTPPPPELYEKGVSVEIVERLRNLPGALDPAIKSGNLLNNLLARFEMKNPDSFEILLPNHRGELTEGSLSNLFLVDGRGRLVTPSPECGLLLGITREHVMLLARGQGLEVLEARVMPEDLLAAREAFITASTLEIMPVARVGEHKIGEGRPGPVTRRLREAYRLEVCEYCVRHGS